MRKHWNRMKGELKQQKKKEYNSIFGPGLVARVSYASPTRLVIKLAFLNPNPSPT